MALKISSQNQFVKIEKFNAYFWPEKAVCYKNGYYEKDVLIFLESKIFQKKKKQFSV